MIVDAHTHYFAPEAARNPESFAQKHKEPHWLELVLPNGKAGLQGWASPEDMLEEMNKASVDQAVLLGWYWENSETCRMQNEWNAQLVKEFPGRFIAFASYHADAQSPIDELKWCLDNGFQGIGECHPRVQGTDLKSANWRACLAFACDNGWPVNFHVTEQVGHEYPGRVPTPYEEFHWLAREFPELKIILSHAGGLFPFFELNPKVRMDLKNVFYDLAACPLLYDSTLYQKLIDLVGYEKVLWGTDFPLRIFPAIQTKPDFSLFQEELLSATHLNPTQREAIFGGNLLSLLQC